MNPHGGSSAYSLLIGQTITRFYLILVVLVLMVPLYGQICNAQVPRELTANPTYKCDSSSSNAGGSTFDTNLNLLFESLVAGANQSGFKISSYGQSPHQIYGLLQCREDLTVDQCYTCWKLAKTYLQQNCFKARGGSIWPFHCFLRYEDYKFTGQLDADVGSIAPVGFGVKTGVFVTTGFQRTVDSLLNNLSGEAVSETKRSAFGTAVDSAQTIYGLAQCSRDLSKDNCTACLNHATNTIVTTYSGYRGIQYWSQSCNLRYEIYLFFNLTALSLTFAEGPVNTPPKQITPSTNSKQLNHSNKTPLILGVVGGFVLLLIVCAFATGKRLKSAIFRRRF